VVGTVEVLRSNFDEPGISGVLRPAPHLQCMALQPSSTQPLTSAPQLDHFRRDFCSLFANVPCPTAVRLSG